MDEKESVRPERSTPFEAEIELYQGFKSAGLNDIQAFRTARAIRVMAGHDICETLEVHRRKVNRRVDGGETKLTAKLDGFNADLGAQIDGVASKLDEFKTDLGANLDEFQTELMAETAQLHTELSAELKAMRRELTYFRWVLLLLIGVLAFLVAYGLLPSIRQWFWPDSTPAQSLQAPVESDPPETAVPPETDPPEPTPQ